MSFGIRLCSPVFCNPDSVFEFVYLFLEDWYRCCCVCLILRVFSGGVTSAPLVLAGEQEYERVLDLLQLRRLGLVVGCLRVEPPPLHVTQVCAPVPLPTLGHFFCCFQSL